MPGVKRKVFTPFQILDRRGASPPTGDTSRARRETGPKPADGTGIPLKIAMRQLGARDGRPRHLPRRDQGDPPQGWRDGEGGTSTAAPAGRAYGGLHGGWPRVGVRTRGPSRHPGGREVKRKRKRRPASHAPALRFAAGATSFGPFRHRRRACFWHPARRAIARSAVRTFCRHRAVRRDGLRPCPQADPRRRDISPASRRLSCPGETLKKRPYSRVNCGTLA